MVPFCWLVHMVNASYGWRQFDTILDVRPCLVSQQKLCCQCLLDLDTYLKDAKRLRYEHEAILFFAAQWSKQLYYK